MTASFQKLQNSNSRNVPSFYKYQKFYWLWIIDLNFYYMYSCAIKKIFSCGSNRNIAVVTHPIIIPVYTVYYVIWLLHDTRYYILTIRLLLTILNEYVLMSVSAGCHFLLKPLSAFVKCVPKSKCLVSLMRTLDWQIILFSFSTTHVYYR